jgi:hypothetical protein
MTDFNVATGEEQPLNRVAAENAQYAGEQGELVGIDYSGDNKVVMADAASGTAIQAIGVLFPQEVVDTSGWDASPLHEMEDMLARENKTLLGDRVSVIRYGVELTNDDSDTSFNPGEPVYLDTGGGYTQSEPSSTDDLQQVVGVALTPDDNGRDRILLDVEADYDVSA